MPFLDTEVKITPEGELKTRYFRNPQDKGIIVNAKPHHPCDMKKEVLKNFYKTAIEVSSGPEELQHSLNIVDERAVKNGYEPRNNYPSAKKKKNKSTEYRAPLKLPYLSDNVSNKIRNYVKSRKLPV